MSVEPADSEEDVEVEGGWRAEADEPFEGVLRDVGLSCDADQRGAGDTREEGEGFFFVVFFINCFDRRKLGLDIKKNSKHNTSTSHNFQGNALRAT